MPSRKAAKEQLSVGSPPITEIFRRQTVKASQSDDSHPEAGTPATAPDMTQAIALLQEGHETQQQPVSQAPDNTSDTTSPLAPRQFTYSEATSAPRAPRLAEFQLQQFPDREPSYAGSHTPAETGHDTQPITSIPQQLPTSPEGVFPPEAKKLRFLDEEPLSLHQAQTARTTRAAPLAMTPSQQEQAEEEQDYF